MTGELRSGLGQTETLEDTEIKMTKLPQALGTHLERYFLTINPWPGAGKQLNCYREELDKVKTTAAHSI